MPIAPKQPDHPTPQTGAEIDAAVHRFMTELTGVSTPPGTAARCYDRAAAVPTEVLATLANPR